ncbi:MAG: HAD hydrolase-like protein [Nanopusillaceae archaeon]
MIFSFDFDGTLVDSYTIIPSIYEKIKDEMGLDNGFVEAMLMVEELGDYFGIFERGKWIKLIFGEDTDYIINKYWKLRMENQIILPKTIDFLEKYKDKVDMYLITSKDDTKEIKMKRIKKTGLDKYFNDILIYGTEEFKSLEDAIEYLMDIGKIEFYIDDKNTNLDKVHRRFDIKLFKRIYYPPYPLKLAWYYPKVDFPKVLNLLELEKYIKI